MPDPTEDQSKTPNLSSIDAYETRIDYPTQPNHASPLTVHTEWAPI
jgi:hypothetical protein